MRPRRIAALAATALVVAGAAASAAAWLTTPPGSRLETHVAAAAPHPVPLAAVAPILREAVVATEDERFYRHHGIDVIGILRAIPYDVFHLSFAQGASTITEQTAKRLYLGGNDHTPWRKLQDAALALKLESRYTKQQILAAYLNTVYFGEGATGAWEASERYFGVTPRRLSTAQATVLAGLPQAPSAYDPITHPQAARARQVAVLRSLVRTGSLTTEEADAALSAPLRLRSGAVLPPVTGVALAPGPAFVWWELGLGLGAAAAGLAALLATRLPRFRALPAGALVRVALVAVVLLGAAAAVQSFRVA